MILRALQRSDYSEWRRLYDGYHRFYKRPDLPEDFFTTAFARLLNDDPRDFRGFVAADNEKLLGLVHFVFHPNLWRPEGVCYLQDLFTDDTVRGKGVGRALIHAVYAAADQKGAPNVYWLTAEDNYAGRMLYDRVGVKSPFIRYNRQT